MLDTILHIVNIAIVIIIPITTAVGVLLNQRIKRNEEAMKDMSKCWHTYKGELQKEMKMLDSLFVRRETCILVEKGLGEKMNHFESELKDIKSNIADLPHRVVELINDK